MGIVIEKIDVAYLRPFPCAVVKKTFQVTCGDLEPDVDLILSRAGIFETMISMILQFAPLIDEISVSVLGGFVVPLIDVECLKKCTAIVKVELSRFQKPIGKRYLSLIRVGVATTDIYPLKSTNFNKKNGKNPKNKNSFIDVLQRLKSDH